jgi:hypothetical protein
MQRISLTDFTGGLQESLSPDDFSSRQWAQLKGFVPRDDNTFESQWALQRVGVVTNNIKAVFPLQSQVGTFLVAINTLGELYWMKAPAEDDPHTIVDDPTWTPLTTAQNYGWNAAGAAVAKIPITSNVDYRFITSVPFEVYKYNLEPDTTGTNEKYLNLDSVPDTSDEDGTAVSSPAPRSIVSGVLIHSRRFYSGGSISGTTTTQMAVVAYVNPNGNSGAGSVEACTFPNLRRWPTKSITSTTADPVTPFRPGTGTVAFLNAYPYAVSITGYPRITQVFHPYTYLDANRTLLPGRGFIPRANIGTMWGNALILGDIEWKSDSADAASSGKVTPGANTAPMSFKSGNPSNFGLRDGNTEPHRGSFYYSEDDIDKFDPRSVIRASGTDTRIAGMHMLDNRLIIVTTAGGENDGVIAFSGNLSQLHPYDPTATANINAIRKQIIRGGVGVADRIPDSGGGHITQSCVWSEVGIVVFVDRLGGVFYTNGQVCDRLDRYGPKQPASSTFRDHPAAVGKHLVMWRDKRLLTFTILSSDTDTVAGCWTELVPPVAIADQNTITSMVGSGRSLYFVADGNVWRYALDAPAVEKGCINGTPTTLTVSTRTVGEMDKDVKINWHSVDIAFSTQATCTLTGVVAKAGPALQLTSPTPAPGTSQVIAESLLPSSRSFTNGYYTLELPARIGSQPQISVTATFTGLVKLEAVSLLYTGSTMKSGGTQ